MDEVFALKLMLHWSVGSNVWGCTVPDSFVIPALYKSFTLLLTYLCP